MLYRIIQHVMLIWFEQTRRTDYFSYLSNYFCYLNWLFCYLSNYLCYLSNWLFLLFVEVTIFVTCPTDFFVTRQSDYFCDLSNYFCYLSNWLFLFVEVTIFVTCRTILVTCPTDYFCYSSKRLVLLLVELFLFNFSSTAKMKLCSAVLCSESILCRRLIRTISSKGLQRL